MKIAIITHVPHIPFNNKFQGYSAYVREMNVWSKFANQLLIVAPLSKEKATAIHLPYTHQDIRFFEIPQMAFISLVSAIKTLLALPVIVIKMVSAMRKADHIHLRCPGTIGLVGCFVQVFFPSKPKTAKYAGNWDPKANQPLSYQMQKWILSNTFLTRNMNVLVYGKWKGQTKNIKPFFTASYPVSKISTTNEKSFSSPFKCLFVGTLSEGKRPLYAIQLIEKLRSRGVDITLDLYGEGEERDQLANYVNEKDLGDCIQLKGNQMAQVLENAYKNSQLLLLPSKSEGWPKVVAEAMFWGCVPLVTPISCVPWMIGNGNRGVLLSTQLQEDANAIISLLSDSVQLKEMSILAKHWSNQYTLDAFEAGIASLIQSNL